MKYKAFVVLLVAVMVNLPQLLHSQATSSALSGSVRDATAAVIGGAEVTVVNTETGVTRTVQSNASGFYRAGDLIPGVYSITATMTGFNRNTRQDIVLLVGQELTVNFTLEIGTVEQEVVVTGEAPVVDRKSVV